MIRDLKINYGILDDIVEQLNVYHQALQTMETSLHQLKVYMKSNEGEAIDAWEEKIAESEDTISEYAEQVTDLLTLFDGYVTDTTAYITPVARQAMMRVDRNDIWFNLCQIEGGISQHTMNAVFATQRTPSILNLGDLSQEAREASSHNKAKLELIRDKIRETNQTMSSKMDNLWDLYNSKVKPFENTDDDYSKKAKDIKKKYTSMWEAIVESFKKTLVGSVDFIKGLVAGLVDLVEGVLVLVGNGLILVVSDIIPDEIEPAFLKDKADSIKDGFKEVTKQLLEDPFIIVESIGQSISDTWEEEGIMYASGYIAADVLVSLAGGKALQSGSILGDVSRTGRTLDKLGDTTQALDKAGDVAKQVDRVEDVVKGTGNSVNFGKYSTSIDDKVKVIDKVDLSDWIRGSFTDSNYRTVITEENITFYRTYGGGAKSNGSFVTTSPAGNRINAKIDTALVPDWKNTREFEAVIEVPKGEILNIGRVEKQYTKTGALLKGDGDQILLPQGWPSEWIKDIRKVPSK
ncbi:hypothetical protein [Salipaludibacillus agaradhaerens]|uniref:hypothetical protein n=1 Tax=Salipaludibacillus agaradhaerens TaxID=76935 RepID=UPI001FEB358D|nr:hypothetical protein [Salipaludibacillus agaradhaerens]